MRTDCFKLIESNPIIAAIKDEEGLATCCSCENIRVVYILYGNICNIDRIVDRVKKAGKAAIVHLDLIEGLNGKETVVDFIKLHTDADGIISTKPNLIKRAKERGFYTVLRMFILDSLSFKNIPKLISSGNPDMLEILPGLMPKIITNISHMTNIPVVAGGLISDKEDVIDALSAGAIAVSSTNPKVWEM